MRRNSHFDGWGLTLLIRHLFISTLYGAIMDATRTPLHITDMDSRIFFVVACSKSDVDGIAPQAVEHLQTRFDKRRKYWEPFDGALYSFWEADAQAHLLAAHFNTHYFSIATTNPIKIQEFSNGYESFEREMVMQWEAERYRNFIFAQEAPEQLELFEKISLVDVLNDSEDNEVFQRCREMLLEFLKEKRIQQLANHERRNVFSLYKWATFNQMLMDELKSYSAEAIESGWHKRDIYGDPIVTKYK